MAPPAVQGIAQQLILDRKVGNYKVPDGWFIWSAGNRKEDFAAVFDMPAPLANRFIHLEVKTGLEEFKDYALKSNIEWNLEVYLKNEEDFANYSEIIQNIKEPTLFIEHKDLYEKEIEQKEKIILD